MGTMVEFWKDKRVDEVALRQPCWRGEPTGTNKTENGSLVKSRFNLRLTEKNLMLHPY
jgi:hypothetical protein